MAVRVFFREQFRLSAAGIPTLAFGSRVPRGVEAGRRLHDQHIGIGRVFHLFRLPEEQERELYEIALRTPTLKSLTESTASAEAAMAELTRIAQGGLVAPDGPVKVGTRQTLLTDDAVEDVARHYHDAFRRGIRCFPYFTEA